MSTKTNRPTNDAINAEAAALTELQPRVRERSFFGDDHRAAIGAQIAVLAGRMSMDEVHDTYGEDAFEDPNEFDQYVLDEAIAARDWIAGDLAPGIERPSENWASLANC